ncbi:uncharacterized protein LOC128983593 isoform X2 [Macrosteles quadrilineatus]|uniref:uncharacterized protein LOC128983593 isoform X2 n=1 Tax=Macrosteles quadrilineatus TaxID=74068 RepID=UPI0023E199F6|nr:uncharacterized protein LOC128983593 isoform X2 [Macrosteles quadrilineatus]
MINKYSRNPQRCKERVKARRTQLFDNLRSLQNEESVRDAISQFIDMDLEEINSRNTSPESIAIEDDCMNEFDDTPLSQLAVTDQERWILEEYERMIEMTNAQAEMADVVTCPMCSHGILKCDVDKQVITCSKCSLLLPGTLSLADLEQRLVLAVDSHGQFCTEHPSFSTYPEGFASNLLLLCMECGQCLPIV